jgi:UDP:flavonoid glycosyltransferase YjiC (YdhE family)
MRAVFTTTGGEGHLGPLMPFIRALRRDGDDVLVAVRGANAAAVVAAGLPVWELADADGDARVGGRHGAAQ